SKNFWSSFPETIIGSEKDATERDYVLEVHFAFETLPPADGTGWSAGAKAHYRLLRAGQVLHEETLASRSRADYAYGAPLGEGASDTLDAIAQHIVLRVSQVPELEPDAPRPLPAVATRPIVTTTAAAKAPSRLLLARGESTLDGFEVRVDLGISLAQGLDAAHRAHHRRVVAVAEGAPELREARLQTLTAEIHRHLPRKGDRFVAIFAHQI